ncbi:MAG: TRAP transporter small permease [Dehalococcoidales bacterium]|nr:TRAP transporter small permease [Dehalococcoidales bacterium]
MKQSVGFEKIAVRTRSGLMSFSKIMAIIASLVLGAMMLLTLADVAGRYFFNKPIRGTWELVGMLLVFAGTWGLAYCQIQKSHIRVDILLTRFPRRIRGLINFISYLVGAIGFGLISWRVFLMAQNYFIHDYVTDTLGMSIFPYMIGLTIGSGLLSLILLMDVIISLIEVFRK